MMRELTAHRRDWSLPSLASRLRPLPALIVEADDPLAAADRRFAEALRAAGDTAVTERAIATGHGFDDSRIALTRQVLAWLSTLPEAPAGR